jgi:hypothetical protein
VRDGAGIRSVDVVCSCMYNCILFFFNPSTMSVNPPFFNTFFVERVGIGGAYCGVWSGDQEENRLDSHGIEHLYITSPFFFLLTKLLILHTSEIFGTYPTFNSYKPFFYSV